MTDALKAGPNTNLLSALHLTIEEAGNLAGVARSSIQNGFGAGAKKRPVLSPEDIVLLRESLHVLGKPCDEAAVIECVRDRYGTRVVEYVRHAFGLMSRPFDPTLYSELWFMTPYVEHLHEHDDLRFVRELLVFPGKLSLFTGGPSQDKRLKECLGKEAIAAKGESLVFGWDSPFGCWNSMLIADPRGEAVRFNLGRAGFVRSHLANGPVLVEYIKHRKQMTPIQKLIAE